MLVAININDFYFHFMWNTVDLDIDDDTILNIVDTDDFVVNKISTSKLVKYMESGKIDIYNLIYEDGDLSRHPDVWDFVDIMFIQSKDKNVCIEPLDAATNFAVSRLVIHNKEYILTAEDYQFYLELSFGDVKVAQINTIDEDSDFMVSLSYAFRLKGYFFARYLIYTADMPTSGVTCIFDYKTGNYLGAYSISDIANIEETAIATKCKLLLSNLGF